MPEAEPEALGFSEAPDANSANITFLRTFNFWGSALRAYPLVDGKPIAGIYGKNHVSLSLVEGTHTFSVVKAHVDHGAMFLLTDPVGWALVSDKERAKWHKSNELSIEIEAGKSYYLQVSVIGPDIEQLDEAEASEILAKSIAIKNGTKSTETGSKLLNGINEMSDSWGGSQ